jgi:serine/threonine-protein kinase
MDSTASTGQDAAGGGAATLQPGALVGDRYRVEGLVGEGGMGVVYKVTHVRMRKTFALKVLHAAVSQSSEIAARFEREAVAVGSIDHPNVAAATDFGQLPDGSFFLVCEFIAGRSLRAEVEVGALPPARALGILRGVVSAVAAAHARGIVHRDLKPENVMLVDRDGEHDFVKVIDFGIAKLDAQEDAGHERGAQPLTRLGVVMGTPDYMSPEQALGQVVDARADLYSLGVIFYELLTGHCPFRGEAVSVLRQHVTDEPPPIPADVASRLDPRVPEIVKKLLAKDPAQRFQTAADLLVALDRLGASPQRPGRGLLGSRRVFVAAGLGALAVFAVTVALFTLLLRGPATSGPLASSPEASPSASSPASAAAVAATAAPSVVAASSPLPSASSAGVETTDAGAPGTKPSRKRRTGPGGIYIPPPRTWFR